MSTNPKLTSKNFIETMSKAVKHYPEEPYYFLEINNIVGCAYEILINDVPVFKYYDDGQVTSQIDIQYYMLKSGPQKITYKLYPIGKREDGDVINTLADWTRVDLNLLKIDKTVKDPYLRKKVLLEHHSPNKPDGRTFMGAGLKYYENSFTFDAQLPYENKGWANSVDLSKMDQKELLQKTETAYKLIWQLLDEHQTEDFFGYLYAKEIETCQSEYSSNEDLKETLDAYLKPFTKSSYKLEPLANYKMSLYGNGKLVCLEQNSMDIRFRGESALWGKYKNDKGSVIGNFRKLYLHIPKGKTAFEIIR
ncbi:hypothetical protein HDF26_003277 [Pedobacter cryoconitis]|nr:hypothetical protein [Pedobacter cryoconitis]MBB6272817.1 hypothetical protein [Pedobacter cryoconitis]